jgi:hypothetical protein
MIQMAECDISLSLYVQMEMMRDFADLENNFDTLLRSYLSNVVNVFDNVSATIRTL